MKKIFTTYACLLFALALTAQVTDPRMWPGDINDSGLVNEVDYLYWGIAYGTEGPARPTIDGSFKSYPYPDPWDFIFPGNGLNYFFADANGDGKVDEVDLISIDASFGIRHLPTPSVSTDDFPVNPDGIPAPINVSTEVTELDGAKEVEITIELGTEAIQVDSFYGFSFRLFYDTLFAKQGIQSLTLTEDSWVQETGANIRLFTQDYPSEGYMAVAVTRTDQRVTKGFGKVMRGIIVVEDIIFSTRVDTFDITIDSTRLISSGMQSYITQPRTMQVASIVTNTKPTIINSNELRIFPNPSQDFLNIAFDHPTNLIESINLYNFVGQSVGKVTFAQGRTSHRMSVAHLSKGMYIIVAESKRGLYSQKVFIH